VRKSIKDKTAEAMDATFLVRDGGRLEEDWLERS
jgi:hypothetical protein